MPETPPSIYVCSRLCGPTPETLPPTAYESQNQCSRENTRRDGIQPPKHTGQCIKRRDGSGTVNLSLQHEILRSTTSFEYVTIPSNVLTPRVMVSGDEGRHRYQLPGIKLRIKFNNAFKNLSMGFCCGIPPPPPPAPAACGPGAWPPPAI